MSFAGWSLAQMAMLFGVGAAVVTGLYLLRMRRRQVVVPFAALWQQVTRESESRRLWRRFRRIFSWLLQLLLLALLCLALGDPRPDIWLRDPQTVALVIDRSASMAAPGRAPDRTRLDDALTRARDEIHALGPADRAVVIAAGADTRVVGPLDDDPSRLLASLQALGPTPGEADLDAALALARHAVGRRPGARIMVFTDGAVSTASTAALQSCQEWPTPCEVSIHPGQAENVALTAFAARRYPRDREHVEVLTEIHNLGQKPAAFVLDVKAEGVSVGRKAIELGPGQRVREILADVDAARTRLVARLQPQPDRPDDARLGPVHDDVAYAIIPPLRAFDVTLVSDGKDLFLEAALLTLDEHIRLTGLTPEQAREGHRALQTADLVIFDVADAPLPDALPETDMVVFDPWRRKDSPVPIEHRRDVSRPFLTEQDKDHPLVENVVLKDINVARGTTFSVEPGDQVLVRSLGEPIMVLREGRHGLLAIGFDPRQSDLPLRVAFPVLVDAIVRYFEQQESGFVASLPVGSTREISLAELGLLAEGVTRVAVTAPSGDVTEVPVDRGTLRMRALEPGFFEIRSLDGTSPGAQVQLAVNQANIDASALENRLHDRLDAQAMAGPAPSATPITRDPLWMTLLLLACGLVAVEWISYHRRVTV